MMIIFFSIAIKSRDSRHSFSIMERNRDFTHFKTENNHSALQELVGIATAMEYTWHNNGYASTKLY